MVGVIRTLKPEIINKAKHIKFVFTDSDGVLTDTGVYYSANGEEMKRFSIRDGMGVERLKTMAGIETGIITGEFSGPVEKRAERLGITELHMGVKDKQQAMYEIIKRRNLTLENIAYIGDDTNDLDVLKMSGFSGCPSDAVLQIKQIVDYITDNKGGYGAFRDFAEIIIASKQYEDYTVKIIEQAV